MLWWATNVAVSEADNFAIAASLVIGLPASFSTAALYISNLDCSNRTAISAIFAWISCNFSIGAPNACLFWIKVEHCNQ